MATGLSVPFAGTAVATAGAYPASVTVTGRGFGHGDGLSQYGSLGYAVDYGWDWTAILAHYYGGTTRDQVPPDTSMSVELSSFDGRASTSIVQSDRLLATNADGRVGRYRSIVAVETAADAYTVYGHESSTQCVLAPDPAALVAGGWKTLATDFSSTATGQRLIVNVPDIATTTTADRSQLLGACLPDGSLRSYRGDIHVVSATGGANRTVNVLPIDVYLRGVVPNESIPSWGDFGGGKGANALRAQAVAARTYALVSRRSTVANTCDTSLCQVYRGAARRTSLSASLVTGEDARTDAAIAVTQGVVLRRASGQLAFTQYGSSSGGWTSGANFPAVEDLGDAVASNPNNSWTTTVTREAIEKAFSVVGTLQGVDVLTRNGRGPLGGRVLTMRLRGTKGEARITGSQFRSALGLKSDWFSLTSGCEGSAIIGPPSATPSRFQSVTPTRVVDTRSGLGGIRPIAGCTMVVPIAGLAGVPASAEAVALNVTSVGATTTGFATVFPCDSGRPLSSNLNLRPTIAVANQVTVAIDGSGDFCVFVDASTEIIIDVVGWYGPTATGAFAASPPERRADTRVGAPVPAGGTLTVPVPRAAGVVAVLNVTATSSTAFGFVTVAACGGPVPATSNLNLVPGRDIANQVVTKVSAAGTVCLTTSHATHLIVDEIGVIGGGAGVPLKVGQPERVLDTRSGARPAAGSVARFTPVAGAGPQPASVLVNLTATGTAGAGFVSAYPCGSSAVPTSSLNVTAGIDVANAAIVRLDATKQICLFSSSATHLVVDLLGRFEAS